jgi:hypothetical protein
MKFFYYFLCALKDADNEIEFCNGFYVVVFLGKSFALLYAVWYFVDLKVEWLFEWFIEIPVGFGKINMGLWICFVGHHDSNFSLNHDYNRASFTVLHQLIITSIKII